MELIYPKKIIKSFKDLKELPSAKGGGSGYLLIATAKSGLDLYVCFCNMSRDKVYIEKTTLLNPNKFMCQEDLTFISNEEEFSKIYKFFIEKGILDG
jgi:hypothetical protein